MFENLNLRIIDEGRNNTDKNADRSQTLTI